MNQKAKRQQSEGVKRLTLNDIKENPGLLADSSAERDVEVVDERGERMAFVSCLAIKTGESV